jgi:hypothetical protein
MNLAIYQNGDSFYHELNIPVGTVCCLDIAVAILTYPTAETVPSKPRIGRVKVGCSKCPLSQASKYSYFS